MRMRMRVRIVIVIVIATRIGILFNGRVSILRKLGSSFKQVAARGNCKMFATEQVLLAQLLAFLKVKLKLKLKLQN